VGTTFRQETRDFYLNFTKQQKTKRKESDSSVATNSTESSKKMRTIQDCYPQFNLEAATLALVQYIAKNNLGNDHSEDESLRSLLRATGWTGKFPSRATTRNRVLEQASVLRTDVLDRLKKRAMTVALEREHGSHSASAAN
jgi:hypothetical protein